MSQNDHRQLSPAEVLHIRRLWDDKARNGATAASIARVYGCAAETVARIGRRETWAWLSESDDQRAEGVPALPVVPPDEAAASLDRLLEEMKNLPTKPTGEGK